MSLDELLAVLRSAPLVASVQASENSPVDDPSTLLRLARASVGEGVRVLRLQGVANIEAIRPEFDGPIIGLLKRSFDGSDVYISPTLEDVHSLLRLGCEVIALDGTPRVRPGGVLLKTLIEAIHEGGALAMADCDSVESARFAIASGADIVGTTLAGYTADRPASVGPDLELLREFRALGVPFIAEGRYSERWHVEAGLRIGATGVVVGGALNDPVKQTKALWPSSFRWNPHPSIHLSFVQGEATGAVDIGGTWLRFGVFDSQWRLLDSERTPNPPLRADRLQWIRDMAAKRGVSALGVGTGGIIDPRDGICWTAKEYLMPDQIGIEFSERTLGLPTFTHGDGHATAWGHACLPEFAGRRVATLALGTGVGCGFVQEGKIWAGKRGEYPRINDLPTKTGKTYEEVMGGLTLTSNPTDEQKAIAISALEGALYTIQNLYFPDDVIVAGSVGLSEWMRPELDRLGVVASPFGTDAGIYGAAALALFPTWS